MRTLLPLAALLALLLLPTVSAFGISPPTGRITFTPGQSGAFDVLLINHNEFPVGTTVEVRGSLAPYITATTPHIPARGARSATISYAFPEDIPPGPHRQEITFREHYVDGGAGGIGHRIAVGFVLTVFKPYPGRYAELVVRPKNVPEGQDTYVEVVVQSRGTDPVRGDLEMRVYDPQDRLVDLVISERVSVDGNSDTRVILDLRSRTWNPGRYRLDVRYDYGAGVAQGDGRIIIGTQSLDILNVTRVFYKDVAINRFDVTVESLWNLPFTGVEASVRLGMNEGRTPSTILGPFAQRTLTGYWETDTTLTEGEHTLLVTARFDQNFTVQRAFPVMVYNETPRPREEIPEAEQRTFGPTDVLFLAILLLLLLLFVQQFRRRSTR